MARSTLEKTGEQRPQTGKGHGTAALGPSNSSDSGSDIVGGPGLKPESEMGLDIAPGSLPADRGPWATAGPDVGDPELDGDSDAEGTGERSAVGRDMTRANRDISPDHIESESGEPLEDEDIPDDLADDDEPDEEEDEN